ncbi:MAG TPA: SAM-dependent methyltransferase, partial [Dehalococcoidia bacterium]|nr:SAM-dependent methyltransferase [Dehalococcoidia bacterium]
SPICGLAFPRAWLTALGISFDESLEVGEDWDLLLRIAPFCGVGVSPSVTSHYRNHGGSDSRSSPGETWDAAMRTVIRKANSKPILLPPGGAVDLRRDREQLSALQARLSLWDSHLGAVRRALATGSEALSAAHHRYADLAARHAAEVEAFRSSRSWQMTGPLRALGHAARRLGLLTPKPSPALEASGHEAPSQPVSAGTQPTVSLEYFENLYANNPDPWGYGKEWYEERKYALTIHSLPRRRYRRAFEPGCSIGVLTAALASRCDSLLSVDWVARAVWDARDRVREMPWVEVQEMTVPGQWPGATFDLIVISELARYFGDEDLKQLSDKTVVSLEHGGHLVLVHHRPDGPLPQSAETVHSAFAARSELVCLGSYRQPDFLLDVLERVEKPAVGEE